MCTSGPSISPSTHVPARVGRAPPGSPPPRALRPRRFVRGTRGELRSGVPRARRLRRGDRRTRFRRGAGRIARRRSAATPRGRASPRPPTRRRSPLTRSPRRPGRTRPRLGRHWPRRHPRWVGRGGSPSWSGSTGTGMRSSSGHEARSTTRGSCGRRWSIAADSPTRTSPCSSTRRRRGPRSSTRSGSWQTSVARIPPCSSSPGTAPTDSSGNPTLVSADGRTGEVFDIGLDELAASHANPTRRT